MNAADRGKVIMAGFTIIRRDYQRMSIKTLEISNSHGWRDLEKGFKSKAQLNRRAKELLRNYYIIED